MNKKIFPLACICLVLLYACTGSPTAPDDGNAYKKMADPTEADSSGVSRNITDGDTATDPLPEARKYGNLLVFHVKDSMAIGDSYFATLDLARNESVQAIKRKLLRTKKDTTGILKVDTTLQIAPRMRALLLAKSTDTGKISIALYASTNEQKINDSITTWRWELTPKQEGSIELRLVVEVVDEHSNVSTLDPRIYDVKLYSTQKADGGFIAGVGRFFGGNWQWLISAILIPLGITVYNVRHNNRHKKEQRAADEKKRAEDMRY